MAIYLKVIRKHVKIRWNFLNKLTPKAKQQTSKTFEIPKEWVKDNPQPLKTTKSTLKVTVRKPRKIRLPGLRLGKRLLAGFLFLANGLMFLLILRFPAPYTDYMAFFFLANAFVILDYLFKTRHKPKVEMEIEE